MKVINVKKDIEGSDREVHCPNNGFISNRILLESDGMGYTLTKTVIPFGEKQYWHYKNHLETCYCISGVGQLVDIKTGEVHEIRRDCVYVLNDHDPHYFTTISIEPVILICVFNPPLKGREVHDNEGSYGL